MKTLIATLLACGAGVAAAGPDFHTSVPRAKPLAASTGTDMITPETDVVFLFDSSLPTNSGLAQIDSAARWLKKHPREKIVLEGYADHVGTAAYNESLAGMRANTVRNALLQRGISGDRIVVAVYGELFADPAGNPLDRRVVMYTTDRPTRELAAYVVDSKMALSATWTEGPVTHTQGHSVVARR
jgi:outer membrane protein OmpA-like peptidoglycan-associated protein